MKTVSLSIVLLIAPPPHLPPRSTRRCSRV